MWCVYILVALVDGSWAVEVISLAVAASGKGYVLSYGQVWPPLYVIDGWVPIEYPLGQLLSIYTAVPPLVSTFRFFRAHRKELWSMILRLPGLCLLELKYLFGMVSDPPFRKHSLPLHTTSPPLHRKSSPPRRSSPPLRTTSPPPTSSRTPRGQLSAKRMTV